MEAPPRPEAVAAQVVAALNDRAKGKPSTLVEPEKARWTREFAFATVKADGTDVSILFQWFVQNGKAMRSVLGRDTSAAAEVEAKQGYVSGATADAAR